MSSQDQSANEIDNPAGDRIDGGDNRCISDGARKTILGLLIVLGIAVSWVGATQFTQSTYNEKFDAPFFVMWFSTIWMIVCYPGYFIPAYFLGRNRGQPRQIYRENETVFGSQGVTWMAFFKIVGSFCICWAATNYMYAYALSEIAAAVVTAVFSSNTAFIYILSWVVLDEKFVPLKVLATILSVVGLVVMAYADGFHGPTAVGILLSIGAAIGAAIYKVFFKKVVGDASLGQVSLFLSLLSLFNLFFLWPVMLALRLTDVEKWLWSDMPWNFLCGSAALSVAFNFLINFGIAFTYPLYIAIGVVLGIPLNAVVDYIWRGTAFGVIKVIGTFLIILGFIIMVFPDRWHDSVNWPCTRECAESCRNRHRKANLVDEESNVKKPLLQEDTQRSYDSE
ncbi:solute carrier family 35 member F4-like [Ptychodera flava]|uniref:solute carrier family 35 member F4-like n=1 Tax=Ptychodera flava TaxID=63121 RepID=UPI00396A3D1D